MFSRMQGLLPIKHYFPLSPSHWSPKCTRNQKQVWGVHLNCHSRGNCSKISLQEGTSLKPSGSKPISLNVESPAQQHSFVCPEKAIQDRESRCLLLYLGSGDWELRQRRRDAQKTTGSAHILLTGHKQGPNFFAKQLAICKHLKPINHVIFHIGWFCS